jgi:Arc/MetJ-type ribon-helix-helix transcriptional regulator
MGGKTRINITVDTETIRLADRLARRKKTSRSAILREGVRALAEDHQREAEEAARERQQRQAAEAMDRLARDFGDWPAEAILRAARDRWPRGLKR